MAAEDITEVLDSYIGACYKIKKDHRLIKIKSYEISSNQISVLFRTEELRRTFRGEESCFLTPHCSLEYHSDACLSARIKDGEMSFLERGLTEISAIRFEQVKSYWEKLKEMI